MYMKITVSAPLGGSVSLITLPTVTVATMAFAASSVVTDAGVYSITLQAGYGASFAASPTTILASAVTTITYVNSCLTTHPVPNAFPSMSATVLAVGSASTAMWNDQVSVTSGGTNKCGAINFVSTITTAPGTFIPASMSSIFTFSSTLTTVVINVAPDIVAEIGSYQITTTGCLANYPS